MNTLRIRPSALCSPLLGPSRWVAPAATTAPLCQARRWTHPGSSAKFDARVPPPTPLVPDVESLLTVIGRNMKQHTSKFTTWEALFTLTSAQLKELGVEPPRDRRYLLRWLQRFREGRFGIGGDFHHVKDGVAELRVQETVDENDPRLVVKKVVNVAVLPPKPAPTPAPAAEGEEASEATPASTEESMEAPEVDPTVAPVPVFGYKVVGARTISGPFALPLKKIAGARVKMTEGMWEDKLGRKIDGGERRRAEVRFMRRVAERKAGRDTRA